MEANVTGTRPRVGVWGVFGRGNFGNEATLAALLGRLRVAGADAILFCEDPGAATSLHGVPARRLGAPAASHGSRLARLWQTGMNRLRLVRGAFEAVGTVDSVVIAGTGGLERYGSGAFGTPFEIWSLGVAARLRGRSFVLLDIGVEYLPRAIARFFVRGAARAASYRSYRDAASRECMVRTGVAAAGDDAVVADLALWLDAPAAEEREPDRVVVGVMDYWGRDSEPDAEAANRRYVASCRELVGDLLAAGWKVDLVGGDEVDLGVARRLAAEAGSDDVGVVEARSPEALTRTMARASVVVGTRFHTLVMALIAQTPIVSVGYGEKHRALLLQLDRPDQHVDVEAFSPAEVAALVSRAAADPGLRDGIARLVTEARERLDREWVTVLPVLSPPRPVHRRSSPPWRGWPRPCRATSGRDA